MRLIKQDVLAITALTMRLLHMYDCVYVDHAVAWLREQLFVHVRRVFLCVLSVGVSVVYEAGVRK